MCKALRPTHGGKETKSYMENNSDANPPILTSISFPFPKKKTNGYNSYTGKENLKNKYIETDLLLHTESLAVYIAT